jgi:hypothetical protein
MGAPQEVDKLERQAGWLNYALHIILNIPSNLPALQGNKIRHQ